MRLVWLSRTGSAGELGQHAKIADSLGESPRCSSCAAPGGSLRPKGPRFRVPRRLCCPLEDRVQQSIGSTIVKVAIQSTILTLQLVLSIRTQSHCLLPPFARNLEVVRVLAVQRQLQSAHGRQPRVVRRVQLTQGRCPGACLQGRGRLTLFCEGRRG